MGLGHANIVVNQPTQLTPVMPNQVLEGDRFEAGFTVMNRTASTRTLDVSIEASGTVESTRVIQRLEAKPFQREVVWLPIVGPQPGKIVFVASAEDADDGDRTVHELPVLKRRSLETAANYASTTQSRASDEVLIPESIHTDVGAISVVVSPSVIGNVAGAFRYMQDYPYRCWEQVLSQAVMASHYVSLKSYLPVDPRWNEAPDLPMAALREARSFQAPNGGMTYWTPVNSYVSPYLSAYTALAFNWLHAAGHEVPTQVEDRLHEYLQRLLRNESLPSFYNRGMASSIRAVALAALAPHRKVDLDDLELYQSHVEYMSLFGKSHYLGANLQTDGADTIRTAVLEQIEAHASVSGGKFQFNELLDDGYQRVLSTPLRSNCSILSTLTALGQIDGERVGDVPFKLVRTITQTRGN